MIAVIIVSVIIAGTVGITVGTALKGKNVEKEKKDLTKINSIDIPKHLGIKRNTAYTENLLGIEKELNAALDSTYMKHVKKRVLSEKNWSDKEYDLYLYGMKQFLLMNAVFKSVPMFSENVDEIWHQMLMFTQEYREFSERFNGEMIHHAPNISEEKGDPSARAEFEWLYSQLFDLNDAAKYIYGEFGRFHLGREKINELSQLTKDQLKDRFFKNDTRSSHVAREVSGTLNSHLKRKPTHSKTYTKKAGRTVRNNQYSSTNTVYIEQNNNDDILLDSLLFASIVENNDNTVYADDRSSYRCGSSQSSCSSSSNSCSSSSSSCSSSSSSCSSSSSSCSSSSSSCSSSSCSSNSCSS